MAKDKSGRNLAIGAVFGAVAGFVTGILTAPKKGIETRKDIEKAAKKVSGSVEQNLKNHYRDLSKHYDNIKAQLAGAAGKGKTELEELLPKLEAAKDELKELLSTVRDGVADDERVKKVIKETEATIKKAAKHIK